MLTTLREIRVLDPACGSGNFLYVSLQLLMDLEKEVITHPLFAGMTLAMPEVHPRQMYGIEINPIAHDLATIVVWIGYIQWRQNNGYATLTHREPILEALHDNIRRMDAIINDDGSEPDWPEVDVIVGNPPFLGAKKMKGELGEDYVNKLHKLYEGRLPGFSDLVTYWFEKSRAHLEAGKVQRVGLLATNSIAMGTNLTVLKRIKESGNIFMAWSDRKWILDGAAVRVAMIGFDLGLEKAYILDGREVTAINADLSTSLNITIAKRLSENMSLGFIGTQKSGSFDISPELAHKLLSEKNESGVPNSDVIRPWVNGEDIVRRPKNKYIIYFNPSVSSEVEAAKYTAPFAYVRNTVIPEREAKHFEGYPFWLHWRPRPEFFQALEKVTRYIITPRVSKHRIFTWLDKNVVHDSATVAIARDDDYFFGILHSRLHERWSLRMGTFLGVGNDPRYTPTTTFETFPFPWSPGHEDTASPTYQAVAAAARQLHDERQAWLSPPPFTGEVGRGSFTGEVGRGSSDSRHRTLTNLYNALNVHRGLETIRLQPEAAAFAPRLHELHTALDHAVCAAYGWPPEILADEDELLSRLLALNLQRATP